jgi:hypothetical protein
MPSYIAIRHLSIKVSGATKAFKLLQTLGKIRVVLSVVQKQIKYIESGLFNMEWQIKKVIGINSLTKKKNKSSALPTA